MKREDEEPTEEELREAAALAAALEHDDGTAGADAATPPADALEAASLLRHARAPLAVPPAHEPIAAAHVRQALDARRAPRRFQGRRWMIPAIAAPAAVAVLLSTMTLRQTANRPIPSASAPPPPADLLAAQAEATRGGSQASAALATLELKMRAYRRQYHDGLRRRGGGEP